MDAEDLKSAILYRDQLMIVLDKPAGIPVHAGPSGGENLEDYFDTLRFDYKETPKLAHRLDRDTSGCLVLGRNHRALRRLGMLFEAGKISKTYRAITVQKPPAPEGSIDVPLVKIKLHKGWSMQPAKDGTPDAQNAMTDYKVLGQMADGRWLTELYPRTGRTHQIRVHLQSIGCPIDGDWLYGPAPERPQTFARLWLHAWSISIPLYADKPDVIVSAENPAFAL